MPKINVYLPDDLAAQVRAAGLPVSPICQRALAEALRMAEAARADAGVIRDPGFDPAVHPEVSARVGARMTSRLREAVRLARAEAGPGADAEPGHLLAGVLDEADNPGTRLLEALNVDLAALRAATDAGAGSGEPSPGTGRRQDTRARMIAGAAAAIIADTRERAAGDDGAGHAGTPVWEGLTAPARLAIAAAVEASADLGHDYIGCEHLLLGLAGQDDSDTALLLRRAGADPASLRRAITTVQAGYGQGRQAPTLAARLDDVLRRLDNIEGRLADGGL